MNWTRPAEIACDGQECPSYGPKLNEDYSVLSMKSDCHTDGQVTFRLRHVFVLMLVLAASFGVFPNLGIVLCVSIVPGMISLVIASAALQRNVMGNSVVAKCLSLLAMSCIWFGIYVFSMGPIVAFVLATGIDDSAVRIFYDPVRVLQFHTPLSPYLDPMLDSYTELWGWS